MATCLALQKAAQAWCTPRTERKVMDAELANAFADILDEQITISFKAGIREVVKWIMNRAKIVGSDIDSDMEGGSGEYFQYELNFDDGDIEEWETKQ